MVLLFIIYSLNIVLKDQQKIGNQLKNLKQSKANSPKGADQMLLAEIVRSIS